MEEQEQRLRFASDILFALKTSGCSQRSISAYLHVSHATLSNWRCAKQDLSRKVGVPSDDQLARLVALWRCHLAEVLSHALVCYDYGGPERRESALMLHAIGSLLREYKQYFAMRQETFKGCIS